MMKYQKSRSACRSKHVIVRVSNPENDVIMLCFVEIDYRTQIVKQTKSKNMIVEKVV